MKIRCDACDNAEASVFCVADEAALCAACDRGVHHANKLSRKHHRFSLHYPSSSNQAPPPLCDICQDKRAFLFCREDRAILCKDCDISVHKANDNTKKHSRFLLTGVKLSATSALYSSPHSPSQSASASSALYSAPCERKINLVAESCCTNMNADQLMNIESMMPTSSISEYLMETLPGWHVEDFLDSPSDLPIGEKEILPPLFFDAGCVSDTFPAENMGFWVPQMSSRYDQVTDMAFWATSGDGFKDISEEFAINSSKSSRQWNEDNSFAVPQMNTPSNSSSKRCTTLW